MASGSFEFSKSSKNSAGSYIVGKIAWSATANASTNSSSVTASIYVKKANDSIDLSVTTGGSWSYSITINGSTKSGKASKDVLKSWVKIATYTLEDVAHTADGTKSITIKGSVSGPSGTNFSGLKSSGSKSVTLDPIELVSEVSATSANIGSKTTITIARASSILTHTLTYSFGSLSGTIITKTAGTKLTWTVPTTFYAQIPKAKNGKCTITCTTYNGSTQIGTSTCTFTATASESVCKPTVTVSSEDVNAESLALTGNKKSVVNGISNLKVATTATANNGATISSVKAYCGSKTLSGTSVTFSGANSSTVYVIVTDSRGYSTRVDDTTLTLINYISPTINQTITRDTPTGDTVTVSVKGRWFNGSFGAVANTIRLRVKYKVDGASDYGVYSELSVTKGTNQYTATIKMTGLAYDKAYRFQIRLDDGVYTDANGYRDAKYATNIPLKKGIPVFDWGENDFAFNVPVTFEGKSIADIVYPVGSIYIAYDSISPAERFGGTWTRIENAFLWGIDSTGTVGKTGGEQTHVLTIDEMPEHRHILSVYTGTSVSDAGLRAAGTRSYYSAVAESSADNISKVGGGSAHNNMPPYVQVSIWRRTG